MRLKIVIEPAVSFETDYSDKGSVATNQLTQRIEQAGEMLVEKKVALRSVCSWTISREHSYICLNNPPTTPRFFKTESTRITTQEHCCCPSILSPLERDFEKSYFFSSAEK